MKPAEEPVNRQDSKTWGNSSRQYNINLSPKEYTLPEHAITLLRSNCEDFLVLATENLQDTAKRQN